MKKKLCLVLCLMMHNVHGYIYQAVVMRKWQPDFNRFHYFIGLGDLHDKKHPSNGEHVQKLEQLLANTQKDDLKLFTEDLSAANSDGHYVVKGYLINSRGGILGGLTDKCRTFGIDVDNLEYRYARVCALGPVLNNRDKNIFDLASTCKINIGDFTNEIYDELDRIALFQDGAQCNGWYKKNMQNIKRKMRDLDWPSCQNAHIAEYLSCMNKPLVPFINHLLTFDASILDMKMVHEITQHTDKERICAIAGGSHIDRASKVLKKIGYSSVFQAKPTFQRVSNIDVGNVQNMQSKPQPISLDLLQKFF
ncbi:MAG: hypothetical protein WD055_03705 [Candidatus Dependentiae bacterium]